MYQDGPLVLVDGPSVKVMTAAEAPTLGNNTDHSADAAGGTARGRSGPGPIHRRSLRDTIRVRPSAPRAHHRHCATSQGETWMNGITGVVRMRTRDLESAFAHPQQAFRYELFDFRDGLPGHGAAGFPRADRGGGFRRPPVVHHQSRCCVDRSNPADTQSRCSRPL